MNSLEAAGSNGDDRGSLRHAHATRPGCVGHSSPPSTGPTLAEHLGIRLNYRHALVADPRTDASPLRPVRPRTPLKPLRPSN